MSEDNIQIRGRMIQAESKRQIDGYITHNLYQDFIKREVELNESTDDSENFIDLKRELLESKSRLLKFLLDNNVNFAESSENDQQFVATIKLDSMNDGLKRSSLKNRSPTQEEQRNSPVTREGRSNRDPYISSLSKEMKTQWIQQNNHFNESVIQLSVDKQNERFIAFLIGNQKKIETEIDRIEQFLNVHSESEQILSHYNDYILKMRVNKQLYQIYTQSSEQFRLKAINYLIPIQQAILECDHSNLKKDADLQILYTLLQNLVLDNCQSQTMDEFIQEQIQEQSAGINQISNKLRLSTDLNDKFSHINPIKIINMNQTRKEKSNPKYSRLKDYLAKYYLKNPIQHDHPASIPQTATKKPTSIKTARYTALAAQNKINASREASKESKKSESPKRNDPSRSSSKSPKLAKQKEQQKEITAKIAWGGAAILNKKKSLSEKNTKKNEVINLKTNDKERKEHDKMNLKTNDKEWNEHDKMMQKRQEEGINENNKAVKLKKNDKEWNEQDRMKQKKKDKKWNEHDRMLQQHQEQRENENNKAVKLKENDKKWNQHDRMKQKHQEERGNENNKAVKLKENDKELNQHDRMKQKHQEERGNESYKAGQLKENDKKWNEHDRMKQTHQEERGNESYKAGKLKENDKEGYEYESMKQKQIEEGRNEKNKSAKSKQSEKGGVSKSKTPEKNIKIINPSLEDKQPKKVKILEMLTEDNFEATDFGDAEDMRRYSREKSQEDDHKSGMLIQAINLTPKKKANNIKMNYSSTVSSGNKNSKQMNFSSFIGRKGFLPNYGTPQTKSSLTIDSIYGKSYLSTTTHSQKSKITFEPHSAPQISGNSVYYNNVKPYLNLSTDSEGVSSFSPSKRSWIEQAKSAQQFKTGASPTKKTTLKFQKAEDLRKEYNSERVLKQKETSYSPKKNKLQKTYESLINRSIEMEKYSQQRESGIENNDLSKEKFVKQLRIINQNFHLLSSEQLVNYYNFIQNKAHQLNNYLLTLDSFN